MNKNLLKNRWILTGMLVGINIIFGLIILGIVELFHLGNIGIVSLGGILGALIVGQIYAVNFNEVMPKKLKM